MKCLALRLFCALEMHLISQERLLLQLVEFTQDYDLGTFGGGVKKSNLYSLHIQINENTNSIDEV